MLFNMALKNGNLISIDEVDSGLKCDCFCPVCNSPLVARKGYERVHHFAHYNSSDCENYGESMLHLLAKKILEENKYVIVPSFNTETGKYIESYRVDFSKIEIEKTFEDIKPDIIAWDKKKNRLFIEIAVTHKVGLYKLELIKKYNVSTLEIDLGNYYRSNKIFNYDLFRETLLEDLSNKTWIFDKKFESKLAKYNQYIKKIEYEKNLARIKQKKFEEENRLLKAEVKKISLKMAFERYLTTEIIGFLWKDERASLSGGIIYKDIKFDIVVSENPFSVYLARPHIMLRLHEKNKQFQKCGFVILEKGQIRVFQNKIDIILEQNKFKDTKQAPDYFIKRRLSESEILKAKHIIKVEKNYFCNSCKTYFSEEDMGEYQLNTKVGKCRICLNPDLQRH